MANGIVNDRANDIVNAIHNFIARSKADSPVHVEVNDLANAIDNDRVNRIFKVHPLQSQWQSQQCMLCLW
jgi:hypothetical protein